MVAVGSVCYAAEHMPGASTDQVDAAVVVADVADAVVVAAVAAVVAVMWAVVRL